MLVVSCLGTYLVGNSLECSERLYHGCAQDSGQGQASLEALRSRVEGVACRDGGCADLSGASRRLAVQACNADVLLSSALL